MQETPFFFRSGNHRLFGIWHLPSDEQPVEVFVFCHPFGEEKLWSHRVYVELARAMAERGIAVLRFDYTGNGDSEGEFQNSTVDTQLSDIKSAVELVWERFGKDVKLGFFGLRYGATLAALSAEQLASKGRLLLWEPITDGEEYMQEILRSNLSTQLAVYGKISVNRDALIEQMRSGITVNVDGYEISNAIFTTGSKIKLNGEKRMYDGPCLIMHIARSANAKRADLNELKSAYSQAVLVKVVEQPLWRETKIFFSRQASLLEPTLNWLVETHA